MELWDREMSDYQGGRLEELAPARRLDLAIEAVAWTIESLPKPLADRAAHSWIADALVACRAAVEAGQPNVHLPAELDLAYEDIAEGADEPGVAQYLSAAFTAADPGGVDGGRLYGILAWLYEGSLDREDVAAWTLEAEEANPRCKAVIDHQKQLIESAGA